MNPENFNMPPKTTKINNRQVIYKEPINWPSELREFNPYLPMVKAIAPKAPRGATYFFYILHYGARYNCTKDNGAIIILIKRIYPSSKSFSPVAKSG